MNAHFEQFVRIVDEDRALANELWAIPEPMQLVAAVVRRAAERGIILADGEVWEAFNAGRLAWLETQTP